MTKKMKVVFAEGCFDELSKTMTQEEIDALKAEVERVVASGELEANATPLADLPEDELDEVMDQLSHKPNTRQ